MLRALALAHCAVTLGLRLPLTILQFADLHFGEAEDLSWGPAQDVNSTRVMRNVLAAEPDAGLAVFSGDLVTGNNVESNATAYWALALREAESANLPFATIFGNHDDAPLDAGRAGARPRALSSTGRRALLDFERAAFPALSLTCGAPGDGGCPASLAPSASNYFLLVDDAAGAPAAVLFFLDSGGGDYAETLLPSVTDWLASTAAALAAAHGRALPALVFVHIPPPEFAIAAASPRCVGLADDGVTPTVGPNGLVSTLLKMTAVRAVFVGHDHGNANCCPFASLQLCFGRHSGYGGYGEWDRGARVLELAVNASAPGGVGVRTRVRMENSSSNSEEWI